MSILPTVHIDKINVADLDNEKIQDLLIIFCKQGDLATIKFLYKKISLHHINFNYNFDNEIMFRKACTSGNLSLVKYLISENKKGTTININAFFDNAFKRACKHNHNSIIKYLYCFSLKNNTPINIHLGSNYCFRIACKNNNLFLVKFLYRASLQNKIVINVNSLNDQPFKWACDNNNCDIAKFLLKISKKHKMPINIKQNNNEIFIKACELNNINIVNLLITALPNYYYFTVVNNKITKYGLLTDVRKSLNMIQDSKINNPCNILGIKKVTKKSNNYNECSICYSRIDDLGINNKLIKLSCNHVNCLECLLILHDQLYEDDQEKEEQNYDNKIKCFRSNNFYNLECAYCKKHNSWKDCTIIKS